MRKQKKTDSGTPKQKKANQIHHPDDVFAKYMLSHSVVAAETIRYVLAPEMAEMLDFSTLAMDKDSFVSSNLKARYADIVYRIQFKGEGQKTASIRFIKEPKSQKPSKNKAISPQLMLYSAFSMDYDQRQNVEMALPIPIFIYHGSKSWEGEKLADFFKNVPEQYKKFVPVVHFLSINTNQIDDEVLLAMNFNFLSNFLFALKYARKKKGLLQNFDKIFIFASGDTATEVSENIFEVLFLYVNHVSTLNSEAMTDLINTLPPKRRKKAKTLYEQFLEKGEERGIAKGFEKGIEKGIEQGIEKGIEQGIGKKEQEVIAKIISKRPTWTDKEIADFIETSPALVQKVRKDLAKK